ncbi:hypothetical protein QJS04_geneDACA022986 [Acorus gramineus]|uniref:Uncharacterized protein n=1 Tax=Acorus gramineus TaxID=55184 RepID=A0AAV9BMA1_ACOGR|nr:hypothetical protein QJS04_geneDACA022986 [Acorus gramineus]
MALQLPLRGDAFAGLVGLRLLLIAGNPFWKMDWTSESEDDDNISWDSDEEPKLENSGQPPASNNSIIEQEAPAGCSGVGPTDPSRLKLISHFVGMGFLEDMVKVTWMHYLKHSSHTNLCLFPASHIYSNGRNLTSMPVTAPKICPHGPHNRRHVAEIENISREYE